MERYRNAFENTGDSQKSSEAMFARKVILVEGESEVLILPYLFSLCGYDEVAEGVTIVRCGGKSELDRYYRLYTVPDQHCGNLTEAKQNFILPDQNRGGFFNAFQPGWSKVQDADCSASRTFDTLQFVIGDDHIHRGVFMDGYCFRTILSTRHAPPSMCSSAKLIS